MTETAEATRRPGRPRSERARQAILAAAIELLLDRGLRAMSIEEVAENARGQAKPRSTAGGTSKDLLALDALSSEWALPARDAERNTGSLRGDLLAQLRPWLRQLNEKPYGRSRSPGSSPRRRRTRASPSCIGVISSSRDATRRAPCSCGRSTEVRSAADTDLDVALDLLYGPIYHRLLHGHAPLTDRFIQQVVDAVIASASSRRP